MLERGKMDRNVIEMVEIDSLVPEAQAVSQPFYGSFTLEKIPRIHPSL